MATFGQSRIPTTTTIEGYSSSTPIPTEESAKTLDVFGRPIVTSPHIIFSNKFEYGLNPLLWETTTTGTGSISYDSLKRMVKLSVTSGGAGKVTSRTRQSFPYCPGLDLSGLMTGLFNQATVGLTQRLGFFSERSGFFFMTKDLDKYFTERTDISGSVVDNPLIQSSWSEDHFDGNGPSGYNADWTKDQIYAWACAWLGVGNINMGHYLQDGRIHLGNISSHVNELVVPYMPTATLPLTYEIESTGGINATMYQLCSALIRHGEVNGGIPVYPFSIGHEIAAAKTVTTNTPLIALRPKTTFKTTGNAVDFLNAVWIKLHSFDIYASSNLKWSLWYYPVGTADPLSGGTGWFDFGSESASQYNLTATTLSLTNAICIDTGYIGTAGGSTRTAVSRDIDLSYPLTVHSSGTGVATIVLAATGSGSASASISIKEER